MILDASDPRAGTRDGSRAARRGQHGAGEDKRRQRRRTAAKRCRTVRGRREAESGQKHRWAPRPWFADVRPNGRTRNLWDSDAEFFESGENPCADIDKRSDVGAILSQSDRPEREQFSDVRGYGHHFVFRSHERKKEASDERTN